MNPEYMSTLFTDAMGQNMVMGGSFLMVAGAIIMKRMVAIKV
jgi:Flp pilus assembly protein TadB